MPIDIVAGDARLEGKTPATTSGAISLSVDADTPLDEFFRRIDLESQVNRGLDTLYILANGVYIAVDDMYAIQFCSEYISYRTIDQFVRLRDKVKKIVLFVCAASETDLPPRGDRDLDYAALARMVQAEVVIARRVEKNRSIGDNELFDCDESSTEFGEWDGTVSRYNDRGQLVTEYHKPNFHFVDGRRHDSRSDEDPITLQAVRMRTKGKRFPGRSI